MTPEVQIPNPGSWACHLLREWGFCGCDYTKDFEMKRWSWVRVEPRCNSMSLQEGSRRRFENWWGESAVVMETKKALKTLSLGHWRWRTKAINQGVQELIWRSCMRRRKGRYPGAWGAGTALWTLHFSWRNWVSSSDTPNCKRINVG